MPSKNITKGGPAHISFWERMYKTKFLNLFYNPCGDICDDGINKYLSTYEHCLNIYLIYTVINSTDINMYEHTTNFNKLYTDVNNFIIYYEKYYNIIYENILNKLIKISNTYKWCNYNTNSTSLHLNPPPIFYMNNKFYTITINDADIIFEDNRDLINYILDYYIIIGNKIDSTDKIRIKIINNNIKKLSLKSNEYVMCYNMFEKSNYNGRKSNNTIIFDTSTYKHNEIIYKYSFINENTKYILYIPYKQKQYDNNLTKLEYLANNNYNIYFAPNFLLNGITFNHILANLYCNNYEQYSDYKDLPTSYNLIDKCNVNNYINMESYNYINKNTRNKSNTKIENNFKDDKKLYLQSYINQLKSHDNIFNYNEDKNKTIDEFIYSIRQFNAYKIRTDINITNINENYKIYGNYIHILNIQCLYSDKINSIYTKYMIKSYKNSAKLFKYNCKYMDNKFKKDNNRKIVDNLIYKTIGGTIFNINYIYILIFVLIIIITIIIIIIKLKSNFK